MRAASDHDTTRSIAMHWSQHWCDWCAWLRMAPLPCSHDWRHSDTVITYDARRLSRTRIPVISSRSTTHACSCHLNTAAMLSPRCSDASRATAMGPTRRPVRTHHMVSRHAYGTGGSKAAIRNSTQHSPLFPRMYKPFITQDSSSPHFVLRPVS